MMNKQKASKNVSIVSKSFKLPKIDNGDYFESGLWPHSLVNVRWGFQGHFLELSLKAQDIFLNVKVED